MIRAIIDRTRKSRLPSKRQDLVIFGNSELAEVACVYLQKDSEYNVVAFTVHAKYLDKTELLSLPIVPFENLATYPPQNCKMFVAIGYRDLNRVRERVYNEAKKRGYDLIRYVNSKATHWGDIQIGDNCFIFEGNVIQPFVKIGNDVIIWSGNHIGHHAVIGDHCFIASHVVISGGVRIGSHCFIGVNATIRDHISIADGCIIGAGAIILKDTKPGEMYASHRTEARVKALGN